ncbi:MAG: GTPase ObgE [Exilispira sp.]
MSYFLDEITLYLRAGNGGNGAVSFRREKFVPKGGPDGGDGGDGGSIYFIASKKVSTFAHLKYNYRFHAQNGENGRGKNQTGKNGKDIFIELPPGTIVYEDNQPVIDLKEDGQKFLAAKGGKGGKGNQHFATAVNQTPRKATHGQKGEEKKYFLQLKLIADIGLVGFPNAGKSTFLSLATNAHPKIAPYPFTTIYPNLGTFSYDGLKYYIIADIPGIIEGASSGKGLGIRFLKHIERTSCLFIIIDGEGLPYKSQLLTIFNELLKFNENLIDKPFLIAISKIDIPDVKEKVSVFFNELPIIFNINNNKIIEIKEIISFSSFSKEGFDKLLQKISILADKSKIK